MSYTSADGGIESTLGGNLKIRGAAEWVTDESVPDPVIPKVLGERIAVRPLGITNKIRTKSGMELFVPETGREKQESALSIGKVVGIGEYAGHRPNVSRPEIGDYVLFPKYGGDRVDYNGVKLIFVYDDTLLAIVDSDLAHNITKGL